MKFPLALISAATVALIQSPVAVAELDEKAFAAIAKAITVVIHGQNPGSGVIIAKEGNTYSVLTAKHVVPRQDEYEIVVSDGQSYALNYATTKKLPDMDLAIVQFTSSQNYPIALMGNSENATEGEPVYISGWPHPGRAITQRIFQMTAGEISGLPLGELEDGYGLVYTNVTRAGMSGGPVFDSQGTVVGIHGRAEGEPIYNPDTGDTVAVKSGFNLAIPINSFFQKAKTIGVNLPYGQLHYFGKYDLELETDASVTAGAITPNNRTLITGYGDGTLHFWNIVTGELQRTLTSDDAILELIVSPDGQRLISRGENGQENNLKIWDIASGTVQKTLTGNKAIALSADGKTLATGNREVTAVQLWDISTGTLTKSLTIADSANPSRKLDVAFSSSSQTVAIATQYQAMIWNWQSSNSPISFEYRPNRLPAYLNCVAISPDGQTLAGGYLLRDKKGVVLWDIETGEQTHHLQGGSKIPKNCDLSFSPSGQTLIYSGSIGTQGVSLWNVQTQKRFVYPEARYPAVFSRDGQTLVTGRIALSSTDNPDYVPGANYLTIWQALSQ